MSEKLFVHVGLGKTATTTLQRFIFKKIAAANGYDYLRAGDIAEYVAALERGTYLAPMARPAPTLISCESLVAWNPCNWENYADQNLSYFGSDATILLVIRSPSAYLRSAYLQECVHEGRMIVQDDYFTDSPPLDTALNIPQFNMRDFNYQRLIHLYSDRFETVVVQKMEHLTDLEFLDGTFQISPDLRKELIWTMSNTKSNRAYSKTAVNLSFALNNLFTGHRKMHGRDSSEPVPFKRRFYHRMWRKFVQNVFDKILPYKKFDLNWDSTNHFDRAHAEQQYKAMPKLQILSKT